MPTAKELTLNDLKTCPKSEFYSQCDGRLIAFLDSITKKTGKTRQTSSATKEERDTIVNFKSNAYENILKARNLKCVTIPGIREHLVVYFSTYWIKIVSILFNKLLGVGFWSLKLGILSELNFKDI